MRKIIFSTVIVCAISFLVSCSKSPQSKIIGKWEVDEVGNRKAQVSPIAPTGFEFRKNGIVYVDGVGNINGREAKYEITENKNPNYKKVAPYIFSLFIKADGVSRKVDYRMGFSDKDSILIALGFRISFFNRVK